MDQDAGPSEGATLDGSSQNVANKVPRAAQLYGNLLTIPSLLFVVIDTPGPGHAHILGHLARPFGNLFRQRAGLLLRCAGVRVERNPIRELIQLLGQPISRGGNFSLSRPVESALEAPMASRIIVSLTLICTTLMVLRIDGMAAERCLDQVLRIAERHGVSTDVPTVSPHGGPDNKKQDLGESGGVVKPPPVRDDMAIISPPADIRDRMPDATARQDHPAAKRMTLRAILTAARAEAERGNEAGCREGLAQANKFLERGE